MKEFLVTFLSKKKKEFKVLSSAQLTLFLEKYMQSPKSNRPQITVQLIGRYIIDKRN